jgi:uncharacterized membrane protein
MAQELTSTFFVLLVIGLVLLLFYLYVTSIEKVLERIGFTKGEAGIILTLTLLLGWLPIPLFPYADWWIGISVGGGIIPLIVCYILVRSKRVGVAEGTIGVIIVAYVTYFITRVDPGVGIVADLQFAFVPALAAGLYSLSAFWIDARKAASLAYFSGVVGTLVGADVFHLSEMLATSPPAGEFTILSIGGGNIFDMVYMTGIAAVLVDVFVLWVRRQEKKHGFERVISDWEKGAEGLPYARDMTPARRLEPGKKGRIQ